MQDRAPDHDSEGTDESAPSPQEAVPTPPARDALAELAAIVAVASQTGAPVPLPAPPENAEPNHAEPAEHRPPAAADEAASTDPAPPVPALPSGEVARAPEREAEPQPPLAADEATLAGVETAVTYERLTERTADAPADMPALETAARDPGPVAAFIEISPPPQPRLQPLLDRIPTVLPSAPLRPLLLAPPVRKPPLPLPPPAAEAEAAAGAIVLPPPAPETAVASDTPAVVAPAPPPPAAPPPARLHLVPPSDFAPATVDQTATARSHDPLLRRPQTPPPEALRHRPAVPPPPDGYRARPPLRPPPLQSPAPALEPAPPPEAIARPVDAPPAALAPDAGLDQLPQAIGPPLPWRALLRRAILAAGLLGVLLVAGVLVLVVLYRWVDPPASTLMLGQRLAGTAIYQTWVPLERMSPNLRLAVLLSEDGQFCRHRGVDWGELREAIDQVREGGGARGGSTITMQVVKNLFLWPSKSYLRKAVEIPLAFLIEGAWSKARILEIYLNIAEWGPGVFGAEAAARYHFRKPAAALSPREAALLAVSLPNPFDRQAGRPGPGTSRLAETLQGRMRRTPQAAACVRDTRNLR